MVMILQAEAQMMSEDFAQHGRLGCSHLQGCSHASGPQHGGQSPGIGKASELLSQMSSAQSMKHFHLCLLPLKVLACMCS